MDLQVKKLREDAILPEYAHDGDAGLDLFAVEKVTVHRAGHPENVGIVATGIAVNIPEGYVGLIHPRSGLAANKGLTVLNAPGTVDAGYEGEIKVILTSHNRRPVTIEKGEKVAQMLIQSVERVTPKEVKRFTKKSASKRGTGGFGSTGSLSTKTPKSDDKEKDF